MRINIMKRCAITAMVFSALAVTAEASEGQPLGTIVIEADVLDTSNTYLLPEMRSATKTDTEVSETPQALTVLTRKQFDDQNTQTVGQALRYTAGVLSEIDSSTRYDSVFLRGFGAFGTDTQFVSFLDGLRLPRGQGFAQTAIDPFLLDRVDVLKGPSSLIYGQTSPGGLVNMVSRNPDGSDGGEVRLEYGTDQRLHLGVDLHGLANSSGTLQYSVAAMGRKSNARYAGVEEQRNAIAPVLVWQPTDRTRLTVGGYWQRDPEGGYFNSIYPAGLTPRYADALTRELNVGDPGFESFNREQWGLFTGLEHGFTPALTLRSKVRLSSVNADFLGMQIAGAIDTNGNLPRQALKSYEDVRGLAWDTNFEYRVETGLVTHRILTGIDLLWNQSNWQYFGGAAPDLNVLDPVYSGDAGPFSQFIGNRQRHRQGGVYLNDQLSVGNLKAILGARHDWIESQTQNRLSTTTASQHSDAGSYRAGLLYLFDTGLSSYLNFSTSFQPVVGVDAMGSPFSPSRADQLELGVKYQPQGLDALLTLAAFDIRQENVLTPDTTPGFSVQNGKIRSRGLELEARGNLSPQLEVIAALTGLDTEVRQSNVAGIIGNRPQAVPEYYGSLWLTYDSALAVDGLKLGGGVRFVGSSYGDDANTLKAAGYTLADVAMRYNLGKLNPGLGGLEVTLNVRNLFDEEYYSSCSYDIYCQYGESRSVLVGLRKRW
ncbi:TonB-dependent siderophore receptor [Marinobacter xestospongiae]|uniref:TonB-dependent siderophore receptor n=1 Tax=Marinobacter xestospongiae TaxID=994319 RepID=A0ABU3W0I0_9GAMM|nr:TonB-dependent siderophore receptor [Marinobacter xestospongiae]MDV2079697.1 TonB-dependent siderophore receptor [Marinobacter xestospongiae]